MDLSLNNSDASCVGLVMLAAILGSLRWWRSGVVCLVLALGGAVRSLTASPPNAPDGLAEPDFLPSFDLLSVHLRILLFFVLFGTVIPALKTATKAIVEDDTESGASDLEIVSPARGRRRDNHAESRPPPVRKASPRAGWRALSVVEEEGDLRPAGRTVGDLDDIDELEVGPSPLVRVLDSSVDKCQRVSEWSKKMTQPFTRPCTRALKYAKEWVYFNTGFRSAPPKKSPGLSIRRKLDTKEKANNPKRGNLARLSAKGFDLSTIRS